MARKVILTFFMVLVMAVSVLPTAQAKSCWYATAIQKWVTVMGIMIGPI